MYGFEDFYAQELEGVARIRVTWLDLGTVAFKLSASTVFTTGADSGLNRKGMYLTS